MLTSSTRYRYESRYQHQTQLDFTRDCQIDMLTRNLLESPTPLLGHAVKGAQNGLAKTIRELAPWTLGVASSRYPFREAVRYSMRSYTSATRSPPAIFATLGVLVFTLLKTGDLVEIVERDLLRAGLRFLRHASKRPSKPALARAEPGTARPQTLRQTFLADLSSICWAYPCRKSERVEGDLR